LASRVASRTALFGLLGNLKRGRLSSGQLHPPGPRTGFGPPEVCPLTGTFNLATAMTIYFAGSGIRAARLGHQTKIDVLPR
jgi:hypothetical protein